MGQPKTKLWITLLTSGLGVAVLTFVANKAWEAHQFRRIGPDYVEASVRYEDDRVLVFLRNNSDEPLDLARARIVLVEPELTGARALGAYQDVTKLYTVTPSAGVANLEVSDEQLVITLDIAQAIDPRQADHFGVTLSGVLGPVDLSKARIHAELEDLKGNTYLVSR